MNEKESIRIGILSGASIVERFIIGIQNSKNSQITAIASKNTTRLNYLGNKYAIKHQFNSYDDLFNCDDLDLIYIPIYNKEHFNMAKKALEHGFHVLLEKPFTLNTKDAIELFELAKRKNRFIMEAQKALFLPLTAYVKELIHANTIGPIHSVNATISYPNLHNELPWFLDKESGGGALYGSGCYPLHYIMYLLDTKIIESKAIADTTRGSDTTFLQLVTFSNTTKASIHITTEYALDNQITFYGEKGTIKIPVFWKGKSAFINIDNLTTRIDKDFISDFSYEIDHVAWCIKNNLLTSPIMTPQITIDTVKLIEDTYNNWFKQ